MGVVFQQPPYFLGHVIVSVCIFRALPNNAKRAHLIYLGLHLSTCNRPACIWRNYVKCQAALYTIDGVVHLSVSPLTLVNHLSKEAFNRPLTHNTDTIHLHSHTHSQFILFAAQGSWHLLLIYIWEYVHKKYCQDKELGIKSVKK